MTKIGKLGVFELRPDLPHVPNVSTRVPKSRYPSKYVDFSPDKHSKWQDVHWIFVIMTHGLASHDRNASGCAFTQQSQPDPFRNRSTAITSRGGRLVPERPGAVERVWTRAPGYVPFPKLWYEHGLRAESVSNTFYSSTFANCACCCIWANS